MDYAHTQDVNLRNIVTFVWSQGLFIFFSFGLKNSKGGIIANGKNIFLCLINYDYLFFAVYWKIQNFLLLKILYYWHETIIVEGNCE